MVKRCGIVCAVIAVVLAGASGALGDNLLFQQSSIFPNDTVLTSQNIVGQFNSFNAFDDFTLSQDATINKISWMGGWFGGNGIGTIESFTIQFWSDGGTQPGSMLYSSDIPGDSGATFVGTNNGGALMYDYFTTLPTGFVATAGTRYWMSIVANTQDPLPQWGWDSTFAGGDSVQRSGDEWLPDHTDLTFSLYSGSVPEPGSLALVATGIALLAERIRRRLT